MSVFVQPVDSSKYYA